MREALTFDDVLIVPKFSEVVSRKDVDLSVNPKGIPYMSLPVLSANMDSITGPEMARAMLEYGAQAVLHRFCTINENIDMLSNSFIGGTGGVSMPMFSIGLGKKELERAEALLAVSENTIVVDVAHGATMEVVKQVRALKDIVKGNSGIIVGNFATGESAHTFLEYSGRVDGIKIGIGPGSVCSTRVKTGVGYPQFSAIQDIFKSIGNLGISLIADGGIRSAGDVAKAIGAGADLVMIGGMFAGTDETPGEKVWLNKAGEYVGKSVVYPRYLWDHVTGEERLDESATVNLPSFKKYRGSASQESYEAQGKIGSHRTSEGESIYKPCKGPVKNILQDIEGGLRSAMSYVGARTIKEFQKKCEFVRVTQSGYIEGTPHGKGTK